MKKIQLKVKKTNSNLEDYLFDSETPAICKEMNCGAIFETWDEIEETREWIEKTNEQLKNLRNENKKTGIN
jgi:hypothetical protein